MKTNVLSCLPTLPTYLSRLFLFVALFCLGFAEVGKAVTKTWIGTTPSWNVPSNWSPAGVPTSADDVVFVGGNQNCNINVSVTVSSITLQSGYTGLVTQLAGSNNVVVSNFTIDGNATYRYISGSGSFSASNISISNGLLDLANLNNLSLSGNFTMSGGTFSALGVSPKLLYVSGNVSFTGGIFTNNGCMVIMQGAGNSTLTVSPTTIFNNLTIDKPSSNSVTLSAGNTLSLLLGELNITSGTFNANLGNINTYTFVQGAGTTFNAPSGLMVISSNVTIASSANFYHNNGTVELYNADATLDVGVNTNSFYNLKINKGISNTLVLSNPIVVEGLLEFINGSVNGTLSNNIIARGNANIYPTYQGGNAPLIFDSSSDQTLALVGSGTCQYAGNITINKAGGKLILSNNPNATFRLTNSFTFTAGKVELQDELIVDGGTIDGADATKYFITTGAGKLTQNYGSTSTKSFPVGTETRYGRIDLFCYGGVISIAYIENPVIPENTMSGNLVRRSFKEAWRFEGNADIAPIIPTPDTGFSEITPNSGDLTIALLIDGTTWTDFETGSNVAVIYDGLTLMNNNNFGYYFMMNGYITFGSINASQNSLGTGYPNANHITNYNDPININVDENINNTVQITYPYISEASVLNYMDGGETASQWYKFTPTEGGIQISYNNTSSNNAVVELFEGLTPKGYFLVNAGESNLFFTSVTNNPHYIRISSITGSTSSTGILNVAPYLSPDICGNAVFLSLNDCNVAFDLEPFYTEDYYAGCLGSAGNPDGWLSFTPSATTSYTFEYSNTTGDVFVSLLSGSCGGSFSNLSGCITNPTNSTTTKTITFTGTAGITYYFHIKSKSALTSTLKGFACLRQGATPVGDICTASLPTTTLQASAITVVASIPVFNVANTMRNNEGREAPSATCDFTADLDRWTRFNAGTANTVTVEYRNTNKDALISVYQGNPFDDLNQTATFCANSVAGVGTETMTFPVTPNTTYYVRVQNITDNNTMNGRLQIYQTAPPVPTGLAISQVSSTGFGVTWTAIPNAAEYQIEIATNLTNFNTTIQCSNLNVLSNAYNTANCIYTFQPNTIYYVRVRSVMGGIASANSTVLVAKTALPPPNIENPENVTQNSFTAKWNLVVGATGYFIDVSEETAEFSNDYDLMPAYTNLAVGVVSSFNVTGLDAGRTYTYTVRAANSVGSSSNADPKFITIIPATPTFTIDTPTNEGFNLNYVTSLGTTENNYFVLGTNNGGFIPENGSHTVSGLSSNTEYTVLLSRVTNVYYDVSTFSYFLGYSPYATASAWTAPNPPTTLPATDITSTGFTANWSDSQSNVTYTLEVSNDNFLSVLNTYSPLTGASYTVTGLSNLSTYYYRVRTVGGTGLISANSGIEPVPALLPTPPATPIGLSATQISPVQFVLNWTAGDAINDFYVYVARDAGFTDFIINGLAITGTSQVIDVASFISGGTDFYAKVVAYNGASNSNDSNIASITLPPSAPTATAASLIGQTSFTANWNQVVGATSYRLDVADNIGFSPNLAGYDDLSLPAASLNQLVTGLTPNTTYYYRVRAVNGAGTSGNSIDITVTTLPNPPAVPTGLVASGITNNGFQANWSTVVNADDYSIEVSDAADFSTIIVSIPSTGSATTNYFVSSSLISSATAYYFRVAAGTSGVFSAYSTGLMFNTLTNAPSYLRSDYRTSTSFTVEWGAVVGATSYELQVGYDVGFSPLVADITNIPNTVTTYNVTGLMPSIEYEVRVRALNVNNAPSTYRTLSKVKTAPAPPTANTVSNANIDVISFTGSWSSVVGANDYRVQISTENTFTTGIVAGYENGVSVGDVTSAAVSGLSGGTTYYYRVWAIISFAEPSVATDYSNVVAVLTKPYPPTADNANPIGNTSFTANWTASVPASTEPFTYTLQVALNGGAPINITGIPSTTISLLVDSAVLTTAFGSPITLSSGTAVEYRLIAINASGSSAASNMISFLTKLDTPVLNAPTQIETTSFTANWNFVPTANMYYLDVSTDPNFLAGTFVLGYNNQSTGVVLSFPVFGLTAGTTYYYRVRAGNGTNLSDSSTPANVITLPTAPTALAVTPLSITDTGFEATWGAPVSGGHTGYKISLVEFPSLTAVAGNDFDITVPATGSQLFSGLSNTKEYRILIRAKGTFGESAQASINVLLRPTPTAATNFTATGFTANWNAIAGVSNYFVDISTGTGAAFNANIVTSPNYNNFATNTNSAVITGLVAGNTYYYRVHAESGAVVSPESNEIMVLIPALPTAPTADAATLVSNIGFTANWTAGVGGGAATSYTLEYSNDNFVTITTVPNITVTSKEISIPANMSGVYAYRVYAVNGTGTSTPSNTMLVGMPPSPQVITTFNQNSFTATWLPYSVPSGGTTFEPQASLDNFATVIIPSASDATSATFTLLTPNTSYKFRVRVTSVAGISVFSNEMNVTTKITPPTALASTNVQNTSFVANWSSAFVVPQYQIDVATDAGFTNFVAVSQIVNGSLSSVAINNLNPGTAYYYRVRAQDGVGYTENSNTILVITDPLALPATAVDVTTFTANWQIATVPTPISYSIEVATTSTFDAGSIVNTSTGLTNNLLPLTSLNSAIDYYYRVQVISNGTPSEYSNVITVKTLPAAPIALAPTAFANNSFIANWTSVPNVTAYYVEVSTNMSFSSYTTTIFGSVTSGIITGVTPLANNPGQIYYYRVKAGIGNIISAPSNFITILPPPLATAATGILSSSFDANWTAPTGAIGTDTYVVDYSTDLNFTTFTTTAPSNIIPANIGSLLSNTTYHYRVRCIKDGVTTGNSNVISALTRPAAPTVLPATNIQQTQFTARWLPMVGISQYRVQVSNIPTNFASGILSAPYDGSLIINNVDSLVVTGLSTNTNYAYRVYAVNPTGDSNPSSEQPVSTLINPPANAVANVATLVTETGFQANWDSYTGTGTISYRLQVATDAGFANLLAGYNGTVSLPNGTFANVVGLLPNTTYYYRVRRLEDGVFSLLYSNTVMVITAPVAPTLTTIDEVTNNRFKVNWLPPTFVVAGFDLQVRNPLDNLFALDFTNIPSDSISKVVVPLSGNTTYNFRLRARNAQNIFSTFVTGSVLTKPNTPTALTTSNILADRFMLSWAAPAGGASNYLLDVATTGDFSGGFVVNSQSIGALVNNQTTVGLQAGKVYFARLYANNATGKSDVSETVAVITRPTALPASGVTTTGFTANWQKVTDANSYKLYVATDTLFNNPVAGYNPKIITDVNTNSDAITVALTSLQDYYYKVVAVRNATTLPTIALAESPESNRVTVTTLPTAPVALAQIFGETTTTTTQVSVKWNFVAGAEAYYLDVAKVNNAGVLSNFVLGYNNQFVGVTNNFTVLGLNADSTYYFRVRAGKGSAISGNSNVIAFKTAPSLPITLSVNNITDDSFNLTWNHASSATLTNYEISLYELPSPLNPVLVNAYNMVSVANTQTTFPFSGLEAGKIYRAEIRALNDAQYSNWVRPANATLLLPAAPNAQPVTNIGTTSFRAHWLAVSNIVEYRLDVATDAGFTNILPAYTNYQVSKDSTSRLITGINTTSNTYHYRVRAINATGASDNSNIIEVSIPNAPIITLGVVTQASFAISWTALPNTNYRVDVSEQADFSTFLQVSNELYQNYSLGTVNSFELTTLQAGKTYYARLRAVNSGGGTSANSNVVQALLIPSAPNIYTTTNILIDGTNSSFTANWQASLGATEYLLDVSTETDFSTFLPTYQDKNVGNVTSFEVAPVSNNETYYFRVRARNTTGTSSYSPSNVYGTATIPSIDPNTPAQPTDINLSSVLPTEVEITWQDNSSNEVDFEIQRSNALLGTYSTIQIVTGSNATTPQTLTYTDTGLTPLTRYWYRIRARGNTSNSAFTTPKTVVTATDASEIPENLYAVSNDATSIYLEWDDKSDDESGFRLYRALSDAGAPFTLVVELPANATNYTDTGLITFEEYKYVVTSFKTNESEPSNVAFARAAPVPLFPSNLVAIATNPTTINLSWTDNSNNETEFVIEGSSVETEDAFELVATSNANTTSLNLTQANGVKANHRYIFRMFARNAEGRSRFSNTATVNTPINPAIPKPAAPSGLVAESVSTIEIKLRWQDNAADEDYFVVMRSLSGLAGSFTELQRIEANKTSFSDLSVVGYQVYYYQIVAVNGGGSSAPSNTSSTEADCNPILVLVPDNPSGSGAVVCDSKHVELTLNTNVTVGKFYWYRNNIEIPNANLSRYVATETGDYYCRVIAGDCDKKTPEVSVIVNPSFSVSVVFDLALQQLRANYTGANKYQWYYNYAPIIGANAETYKPTQTGSYYVVVTEGACSATSNVFPFTSVTAVESWDISNQIRLYPNPTQTQEVQIKVENDIMSEGEIRLYDQYGKIHKQIKIRKNTSDWQYRLTLEGLSSGMYIIELQYGKYTGKQKLVITN